jgi:hypothetical protein
LPAWHPLVTGDAESVHRAGISVRGQTVSEETLADPEDALDYPAYDLLRDKSDDGLWEDDAGGDDDDA